MTTFARNPDSSEAYHLRRLEMIAARWDSKADGWDHQLDDPECHLNEDDAYQRFLREVIALIRSQRDFCAGHGVVDLGCGTGLVLANVIASFAWGIGVDISPKMVRLAQSKHIPRARFCVGDCFELMTLVPKAGSVLSRGVLLSHYGSQHVTALLAAAKGVLVERGFLVADFLNESSRGQYSHRPEHKTFYTGREVCLLAQKAGFGRATILGEERRRVLFLLAHVE